MFYLDTSLVVAALAAERATSRVQAWLGEQMPGDLFISEWCVTEISSALSMKLRTGQIDMEGRAGALTALNRLIPSVFGMVDIVAEHFRVAARFTDNHSLGLRAGDALHLAVAAEHGLTLCTLDQRLSQGGPPLGVPTMLVH
jgi:predicted nucleic acid-binding protein